MDRVPPVKKGDRLELVCESIGKQGDGIFKQEGFVIIVPKTEKGKTYQIEITKVMKSIAFGDIIG